MTNLTLHPLPDYRGLPKIALDAPHLQPIQTLQPVLLVNNAILGKLAVLTVRGLGNGTNLLLSLDPNSVFSAIKPKFLIGGETRDSYVHSSVHDEIELVLEADGTQISEKDLVALDDPSFEDSVYLYRDGAHDTSPVRFKITQPELATTKLDELEYSKHSEPEQINIGRAEIEAENKGIAISAIDVFQPSGDYKFVGSASDITFEYLVEGDSTETSEALKENAANIQAIVSAQGGNSPCTRGQHPTICLAPGERYTAELKIAAAAFKDPRLETLSTLKVTWMIRRSDRQSTAARETLITQSYVHRTRGEFIRLTFRDEQIFPQFSDHPLKEHRFKSRISQTTFVATTDTDFEIPVEVLDGGLENLSWTAGLIWHGQPSSKLPSLSGPIDLTPGDPCAIKIPVAQLAKLRDEVADREEPRLVFRLSATYGGETLLAEFVLSLPETVRAPSLTFCVDFGASATGVWAGSLGSVMSGADLPLGDFAQQVYDDHIEYSNDGGPNTLLPMAIELSSAHNARLRSDPYSMGNLSLLGHDEASILNRLTTLDRTYDVSIDVHASSSILLDAQKSSAQIHDLKRMFVSEDSNFTTGQFSYRETDGSLKSSNRPNLPVLMQDVFDELAGYFVPNGLSYLNNTSPQGSAGGLFDKWLSTPTRQMQVVLTYPSGLVNAKLEHFKAAGRRFANRLIGDGADSTDVPKPIFVPEGLAAAYGALAEQVKPLKDGAVFACLDIGASTFDAALVKVNVKNNALDAGNPWTVLAHFGRQVGGGDLDNALADLASAHIDQLTTPLSPDQLHSASRFAANGGRLDSADPEFKFKLGYQQRPELVRRALLDAIRAAKIADSTEIFDTIKGTRRRYAWPSELDESTFSIDVSSFLETNLRTKSPQSVTGSARTPGEISLESVARTSKGVAGVYLHIPRSMLRPGPNTADQVGRTPANVARLLGKAVPTLLLRAAAAEQDISSLHWVISGRGALWAPIYEQIVKTAQEARIGGEPDPAPASAHALKTRAINGARNLVESGCDIDSSLPNTLAIVETFPNKVQASNFEAVSPISNITYLKDSRGRKTWMRRTNSYLVNAFPGLDDIFEPELMPTSDIQVLFASLGKNLGVYTQLANLSGPDVGDIKWEFDAENGRTIWSIGAEEQASDIGL